MDESKDDEQRPPSAYGIYGSFSLYNSVCRSFFTLLYVFAVTCRKTVISHSIDCFLNTRHSSSARHPVISDTIFEQQLTCFHNEYTISYHCLSWRVFVAQEDASANLRLVFDASKVKVARMKQIMASE